MPYSRKNLVLLKLKDIANNADQPISSSHDSISGPRVISESTTGSADQEDLHLIASSFLEEGSAADIWLYQVNKTSSLLAGCNPNNLPDVVPVVKKVMRVTADYFRNFKNGREEDLLLTLRQNFDERFQLWKTLDHPSIVALYSISPRELTLFQEYCENGNLREYLKKSLSEIELIGIIESVLKGMVYLHGHNPPIAHGCINPGKIYIGNGSRAKLGEFGLSQSVAEFPHLAPSVAVTGMTRWMSPEYFNGPEPGLASIPGDLWSFGCTLLEVCAYRISISGLVPYHQSKYDTQILAKILGGVYPGNPESEGYPNKKEWSRECIGLVWKLITQCWLPAGQRPSSQGLLEQAVAKESNNRPRIGVEARQSAPIYYGSINDFDIHAEVKALKEDVLVVANSFNDIYNTLNRLDNESAYTRFKSWLGLTPTSAWDGIRKEYDHLLRESSRLATRVAAGAEDFRTNMIPLLQDTDTTFGEKKQKLAKFIADTKETDIHAEMTSQGFVDISRKIRTFQTSYFSQVEGGKEKIEKRIDLLSTETKEVVILIEEYKAQHDVLLEELREGVSNKQDDVVGDHIPTAVGELLGPVESRSPSLTVSGDPTTAAATNVQAQLTQAKEVLNEKEKALRKLEEGVESWKVLVLPHFRATESHTDYICGRLGAIGNIWAVVRSGAQRLHDELNKAHDMSGEREFRRIMVERTIIIPLYDNLEKVAYSYLNAVTE